jgi:molybdopterin-containing oxidoreductase family iron-sulfur binding subunit
MDDAGAKQYWTSWEERAAGTPPTDEFPGPVEGAVGQFSRRGFLAAAGLGVASALSSCARAPADKAVPLLDQPETIVPGQAAWYASTCGGCSAGCGILAKCRDGRPIKLEGNPDHPVSRGGLCAVGQAAVLDLYDSSRIPGPLLNGKPASWPDVDRFVTTQLAAIRKDAGAVRFLSGTLASPTVRAVLQRFLAPFRSAKHVTYDALSSSAILDAHETTHGLRRLPRYRFERAAVIVGFDADFLGTWISPPEFTAGYRAGRRLDATPPRFSLHVQFESRLSLTGSKADRRLRVGPHEHGLLLTHLAVRLARRAQTPFRAPGAEEPSIPAAVLDDLADRLWAARGRSLVVCGVQDVATQTLVNFINDVLGNYGATLDLRRPSWQRQGSDRDLEGLLGELAAGRVAALFLTGVNPVCELPAGREIAAAIERVPLVVSFAERLDETAALARAVCPDHHFLESWSDAETVQGVVSVCQPAIRPLGNTRALVETLTAWAGEPRAAYDLVREQWQTRVFPRQQRERSFQVFWDRAVQTGFASLDGADESASPDSPVAKTGNAPSRTAGVAPVVRADRPAADDLVLLLYPKVTIRDGRPAHNPWLQELPDPISKVTWDNYACLSPRSAERLGVGEGDVVRLETASGSPDPLELPVHIQPGQHDAVVAVALGYGRQTTKRLAAAGPQWLLARPTVGEGGVVGKDLAPWLRFEGGALRYTRPGVRLARTGKNRPLACTQDHHRIAVPKQLPVVGGVPRPIIRETVLSAAATPIEAHAKTPDLWPPDHVFRGHRWAMAIDLAACTGCGACVVACQAENNIPVVGRDEVLRHREMHWLRIDRYYTGGDEVDVVHQPMLCHQCDNAPCETVCPVLATVHSAEGLNQQVYNRCVGTRYCANNCPYKTRRFNWFDYLKDPRRENLQLNPDVTVRSRGVMEKCTFCVQRIHEAKIAAKSQGTPLADGAVQPACQQSCPAQAIVFGDLNDPGSLVSRWMQNPRRYGVLEELNVKPAVGYLAVVRNRADGGNEGSHG